MSVTPEEIQTAAKILAKLDPNALLPFEIFTQYARLAVMPTIEFVPLRMVDGKVQVLLIEREQGDSIWSGEVHIPGSVVRASDERGTFATVLERILNGELKGQKISGEPVFMKYLFHQTKRGPEISFIHWAEIQGEPFAGKFYDVDDLPQNTVEHQIGYIKEAAKAFRSSK